MNAMAALKQYQTVNTQAQAIEASPHRLIQMLMEGGLTRVAQARGAIERNQVALKGELIGKAIGIIGGADGPTSIYLAAKMAPQLLGAIAVAAYSYMSLVPLIQPPIMRALTTKEERAIVMTQLRHVGQTEKIVFIMSAV